MDFNKVKIVGITQPRIEGLDSSEDLIAYCARVSNPANQMNTLTAPKLVKYLMENQHWSPLEMVHVVMEIETPRDIARQMLRHRSFAFQEFSQRYASVKDLGIIDTRECRMQDPKNRQNSISNPESDKKAIWQECQLRVADVASSMYAQALESGIAKEVARTLLPEGLTMSRLYMSGSFRSWYHYCQLRMANGTQLEHQDIANKCWEALKKEFPKTLGE